MGASDEPQMTRDELWAAMRRDSQGMRDLQQYLDEIKDLDDAAFAEATGGADRAETLQLLDRLDHLLGELDKITGQMHPDVN